LGYEYELMYLHETINRPLLTSDLPCRSGLGTNLCAEGVNFSNDQLFHSFDTVFFFEPEIEFLIKSFQTLLSAKLDIETYGVTSRFIGRIMPNLQVGVIQSLLTADAFSGIEA
jgi:hypothetical protein